MNTMQQQQRPTNNPPIFIGQGQNRTQISSESSEWGGDEDENFLFNVEEEYIASQTASKQATTSHRPAPPVLQRLGPARQPVRQLHPGPPAQTVFSTNRPQQAPRSTYPARPQMQLSANNLRPTSQFSAPRPLFQPQASQIIPRATYVPSQAVRHVPHQPQISQQPSKKMPENMQEALQQLADVSLFVIAHYVMVFSVKMRVCLSCEVRMITTVLLAFKTSLTSFVKSSTVR